MTQIPYFNPSLPQDFRDRKGGLVGFGIGMIAMGAICGCLAIAMPLSLAFQPGTGAASPSAMSKAGLLSAMPMYIAMATGLIWCGIGSILARRWVRPIVLIFSTLWLCGGAFAFLAMLVVMTKLQDIIKHQAATSGPAAPTGFVIMGSIIAILMCLVIYIVIPAVLVWFYQGIDVQRTLAFYDPVERWTDRVPLPVLGMSIACGVISIGFLCGIPSGMLSVFGVFLTGIGAIAILVILSGVFATAMILTFRRQMSGWVLAVAGVGIMQASVIVSGFSYNSEQIGTALAATTQELDLLRATTKLLSVFWVFGAVILGIACIGYAVRIRHYFHEPQPTIANPADM